MNIKSRIKALTLGVVAAVTVLSAPIAVYAGYAPSDRQTYTCASATSCQGADHVTFNSITNAANYGDERAFFDGKDAQDTSANGYKDVVPVTDGQKLTLRVYVHNDANPDEIGYDAATAHNTRVNIKLPRNSAASNVASAEISADNATPGTVSDTVGFTGARPFTLSFDAANPTQITYRPNGTGDYVTSVAHAASYTSGTTMDANFGDWHGCFGYSALITTTVIVHMNQLPPPPPPPAPTYSCDLFTVRADANRIVKVTNFKTSVANGAVYNNATVNWGDTSANYTATNPIGQTHQFAKDGTYTIVATANFTANGQAVSDSGPECTTKVTFTTDKPPVVVPPVVTPPTVTPPTTVTTVAATTPAPTTLVNTGAGSVIGLFAAVTAFGAVAHRRFLARRLNG